ncbi:hypothetical protein FRC02_002355 [Tulasnella sp. 418]|nr:hypothetical protein FRC02_002355 [Tulasnella sp. 418]
MTPQQRQPPATKFYMHLVNFLTKHHLPKPEVTAIPSGQKHKEVWTVTLNGKYIVFQVGTTLADADVVPVLGRDQWGSMVYIQVAYTEKAYTKQKAKDEAARKALLDYQADLSKLKD